MFESLIVLIGGILAIFKELVRDEVGQSIVVHVHEPFLEEAKALHQLEEYYQQRVAEIDQLTEELRALGKASHE